MKKQNFILLSIFVVLAFIFTSCNEDKENPLIEKQGAVIHQDLIGTFAVTSSTKSDVAEASINDIWEFKVRYASVACNDHVQYVFSNDTLHINSNRYHIKEVEKAKIYILTTKKDGVDVSITLTKTTSTCSDTPIVPPPPTGTAELDKLYGFAEGTTGGTGATAANTHHFDDGNKFREWLKLREKAKSSTPAIVWLSGTFTKENGRDTGSPWFDIKDTENLTIYGTNSFKMQNVGFFLVRTKNIIIRNVYIVMPKADGGADGISIQSSERIWVDHCEFESVNQTTDYEDGSCDVTHASKQVTVSWNRFFKTQKSCLVGHSDTQTVDEAITATFHHNFFDLSSSRHPRVRYGTAHVYNNYFNKVSTYGVGSAIGAKVLVEGNLFDNVKLPTDICTFPAKQSGSKWVSNLTGDKAGFLFERSNTYINKPANGSNPYPFTNVEFLAYDGAKLATPLTFDNFKPTYNYVMDKSEDIQSIVTNGAGVGKLPNMATAPIAVDNGGITGPVEPPVNPGGTDPVDLGGGWYSLNIGEAAGVTTIAAGGQQITLTGVGKFEGGNQVFNYVYREVSGDFEAIVRVDSYTTDVTSNQSQAGLIFTTDITKTATDFLHALSGKGQTAYYYSHRLISGNSSRGTLSAPAASGGDVYLKLKREGDKYIVSYSLDGGITFGTERTGTFAGALPAKVFLGMAVNSGSTTKSATAVFSDFKINGTAYKFGN